jgi:O-methyltransferase involved in polyketide biosynthesis
VIVTRVVRLADGEELVCYQADVPEVLEARDPRMRGKRPGPEAPDRFAPRDARLDDVSLEVPLSGVSRHAAGARVTGTALRGGPQR